MNRTTFSQMICSSIMILMVLIVLCYNIDSTEAIPIRRYYLVNRANNRIIDIQNPKDFRRIMNEMMTQHQIDDDYQVDRSSSSNKRGIDLGLSRGFSGSQAAKHLIGISAANFAHGPGRKRRSIQHDDDEFDGFNNNY